MLALVLTLGLTGYTIANATPPGQDPCSHGATGKPCRPDPQPNNGKDCEKHGKNGGVNEDHCSGAIGSPSPTPTHRPTGSPSASQTPTPIPSATATPPRPSSTPTPTRTPLVACQETPPITVPCSPIVTAPPILRLPNTSTD